MGARRIRREQRRYDMWLSRRTNGMLKDKERVRRRTRMLDIIRNGKFPFTPPVLTWLSAELDKPSGRIVQADIDKLLAEAK
jgi:hypothetical protein